MAGRIFISYRRSETAWAARALFERLWRSFPDRVFIDLESIALGTDFTQVIDEHLAGCHAMLAVMGKTWLEDILDRDRHGEEDFVRSELARALRRQIPVVPVLIDGAAMPRPRDLPDDLKLVTKRAGLPVTADIFDAQTMRIEGEIRRILEAAAQAETSPRPPGKNHKASEPSSTPEILPERLQTTASSVVLSEPWMHAEGRDAHGRWADLRINEVVQRMRWIEPGEFWMGSTEAERKRFGKQGDDEWKKWIENEAPRHRVQLTQGFWLADTACTQALWQTLLGDNPSHFTGYLDLPVEQVSWYDVTQKFLPALNQRLQGAQALLPTEAQWEYACRAGTETAYSFGELITPEQVNFDGNFPPPGGKKGLYRDKTVAVKVLLPNAWGLYQMHGNVLEWCADALRNYGSGVIRDPDGGQEGSGRALRGGSWGLGARGARCAFRYDALRDLRSQFFGFRFALRSSEQAGGAR